MQQTLGDSLRMFFFCKSYLPHLSFVACKKERGGRGEREGREESESEREWERKRERERQTDRQTEAERECVCTISVAVAVFLIVNIAEEQKHCVSLRGSFLMHFLFFFFVCYWENQQKSNQKVTNGLLCIYVIKMSDFLYTVLALGRVRGESIGWEKWTLLHCLLLICSFYIIGILPWCI